MADTVLSGAKATVGFDTAKADVRGAVEDFLQRVFADVPATEVANAARYAVLGGGHRWRALVAVVADVVAGVAEVGKEQGMDAGKLTAVDLFGVDGAKLKSREFQDRSLAQLEGFGAEADWLRTLVCQASWKAS